MKTINELSAELKLNHEQSQKIEEYVSDLVVELLESIKQDNIKNFDETIEKVKN